jgi:predicted DNA-binding transcriptional regulator YafY
MPKNKNASIRYRAIDKRIRRKYAPFPTIDDLIEAVNEITDGELQVSLSSIQKDIQAMKKPELFGAPIEYCRQNKGYFYTDKSFSIDGIPLNDEEVGAIKFAAGILKQFKGTDFLDGYDGAIDKILAKINVNKITDSDDIIQIEKAPLTIGNEYINPLIQFISNKQTITFEYTKFHTEQSKIYTLHPYLIKEYRNRWYVIGMEEACQEIRTFGIDRMEHLKVSNTVKFFRKPDFDPVSYFKYSLGITTINNKIPEDIELSFTPFIGKYIKSQPWHQTQVELVNSTDEYRIRLKLMPSMELIKEILSYGKDVKVLKPDWLIKEVELKR